MRAIESEGEDAAAIPNAVSGENFCTFKRLPDYILHIMKLLNLILLATLSFSTAIAQFGPQQIISSTALVATRSIPYDLNLDGYTDVISGSTDIGWFQNIDGLGTFSPEIMISDIGPEILELFDLDNDGDMDILYKTNIGTIAWLENIDGFGEFGPERLIADSDYPYTLSVADIDGDGDLDIFANLYHNSLYNRLVWYENMDGHGNFSGENLIEIGDFYISTLLNFDLDNDGDMDLITSYESFGPSQLIWYENIDGLGTLLDSQEIYQFNFFSDWVSIYHLSQADINGDGKIDLLVETHHDDLPSAIYWLENLGEGSFDAPIVIHNNTTSLGSLRPYDLDSDGDNDVLVSFYFGAGTSISWFENTNGQGQFGGKRIISTNVIKARDATAADLNGDGKLDVVSASYTDSKIAWYENTGVLGISEKKETNFTVHPNPTNNEVYLNSEDDIATIALFDNLGRNIIILQKVKSVNLAELQSGIYFIKVTSTEGASETLKVVKL